MDAYRRDQGCRHYLNTEDDFLNQANIKQVILAKFPVAN